MTILTYVLILFLDTYINIVEKLQRVALDVSFHQLYLHQKQPPVDKWKRILKTQWQISERIIREDHETLFVQQKKTISQKTNHWEGAVGNFCVKRVMLKTDIPPSINELIVHRVLRKTGLKWNHVQRKEILTKNELKLQLKFGRKVRRNFLQTFGRRVSGSVWVRQNLLKKWNLLTMPELQTLGSRESLGNNLISISLKNEVIKAQAGMLLILWQHLHMKY